MATPLIRTLQVQGGTLYAFTSASQDLTMAFGNEDLNFEFSKFALIDIPDMDVPSQGENFIQFNTIDGRIFDQEPNDTNVELAQSLQNYALNLESLLLIDDDYNSGLKRTVAERVFWKWMKELGAIRFQEASADDTLLTNKYKEENSVDNQYNRVVKYMGDIEITNNVNYAGNSYSELYLNIPSHVGAQPAILFDTISDANYYPSMAVLNSSEYVYGRDDSTIHPDGLSISAYYDYDALVNYGTAETSDGTENARWHEAWEEDSYYTDLTFDNVENDLIIKDHADYPTADSFTTITYKRSKLDGISLDWNPESYKEIQDEVNMETLYDYAQASNSSSFKFNAALIYYDLYNTSNRDDSVTNLYGILILDNIYETTNKSYIQRYDKFKPDAVTKLNGNAYGLKVNIKFDTSIDNVAIESNINDYNTMSMDLFNDASLIIQNSAHLVENIQEQSNSFAARIDNLEALAFSSTNVVEMQAKLAEFEQSLIDAKMMYDSATSLVDLISQNANDITALADGALNKNIQYNLDVFEGSDGISISKASPNSIKIINRNQAYNINRFYEYDKDTNEKFNEVTAASPFSLLTSSSKSLYLKLIPFTNMARVSVEDSANDNLNIYIDDYINRFKNGQTLKISWNSEMDLNGFNVNIFTDSRNRFRTGTYGKIIKSISNSSFITNKPVIEIICISESTYEFGIDILR